MNLGSSFPSDLHRSWSAIGWKRNAIATATLAAGGNADLVGFVATKAIALHGLVLIASAATSCVLRSDASALTGAVPMVISIGPLGGLILPPSVMPWLETGVSQALNLLNGAAPASYQGWVLYVEK